MCRCTSCRWSLYPSSPSVRQLSSMCESRQWSPLRTLPSRYRMPHRAHELKHAQIQISNAEKLLLSWSMRWCSSDPHHLSCKGWFSNDEMLNTISDSIMTLWRSVIMKPTLRYQLKLKGAKETQSIWWISWKCSGYICELYKTKIFHLGYTQNINFFVTCNLLLFYLSC